MEARGLKRGCEISNLKNASLPVSLSAILVPYLAPHPISPHPTPYPAHPGPGWLINSEEKEILSTIVFAGGDGKSRTSGGGEQAAINLVRIPAITVRLSLWPRLRMTTDTGDRKYGGKCFLAPQSFSLFILQSLFLLL